jgi:hypothetical protein
MSGIGSWYDIHRRILHFCARLPEERYLRVRGEDVLNDTRTQLHVIAAWLGIRTDREAIEAMRHPEASAFARPAAAASGVGGGNDPTFLRNPVPHRVEPPCKLEPPPNWVADPSIWQMVADLAHRLGYS